MRLLGMFARLPEPGKTKTRLAASIGDTAAAALYEGFVCDLMHRCVAMPDQFVVAVTPDETPTVDWFRKHASPETEIVVQPEGDLGQRVEWFFSHAEQQGATRTVLIGSDSPDLPDRIITEAFERLRGVDVVISPASDGGYVLIGMRVPPGELFGNIAWSSAATLNDTMQKASELGMSVELLPCWYDIDTIENLGALIPMQKSRGAENAICPKTNAAIAELRTEIDAALRQN